MKKQSSLGTPNQRRKDASVYRKAAQCLERGVGSPYPTDQIGAACGHFTDGFAENYDKTIVRFRYLEDRYLRMFNADDDAGLLDEILALCFMAAMAETGDA